MPRHREFLGRREITQAKIGLRFIRRQDKDRLHQIQLPGHGLQLPVIQTGSIRQHRGRIAPEGLFGKAIDYDKFLFQRFLPECL